MNRAHVIKETAKNAKEYFKGNMVLQGIYNNKKAVYISSSYTSDNINHPIEMYSAGAGNRYMGTFEATQLLKIEEAKGTILVAK